MDDLGTVNSYLWFARVTRAFLRGELAPAAAAAMQRGGEGGSLRSRREERRDDDAGLFAAAAAMLRLGTGAATPTVIPRRTPTQAGTLGGDDTFKNQKVEVLWGVDALGAYTETQYIECTSASDPNFGAQLLAPTVYADARMDITLGNIGTQYVVNRWQPAGPFTSGYLLSYDGAGTLTLDRWDAGVPTTLTTRIGALVIGDSFGLEAQGTTLRIRVNGATVKTQIDATYASGRVGHGSFAAGTRLTRATWVDL